MDSQLSPIFTSSILNKNEFINANSLKPKKTLWGNINNEKKYYDNKKNNNNSNNNKSKNNVDISDSITDPGLSYFFLFFIFYFLFYIILFC
jgi:hypothetical protein